MKALGLLVIGLIVMSGCATSFTGSPYVENGRSGCESKCKSAGMEVAGLVYMGEYSDACVCAPPGRVGSRQQLLGEAAAISGAGAGVAMQMQRQSQQNSSRH